MTTKELSALLTNAMKKLGVIRAGTYENGARWSCSDLVTDICTIYDDVLKGGVKKDVIMSQDVWEEITRLVGVEHECQSYLEVRLRPNEPVEITMEGQGEKPILPFDTDEALEYHRP